MKFETEKVKTKDKFTEKDIFYSYPHKCQNMDFETYGVPVPYVKKGDLSCDHKHTLTYSQWALIFRTYTKYFRLYLQQGGSYKLPHKMGEIRLVRNKKTYYNYQTNKRGTAKHTMDSCFEAQWVKNWYVSRLQYRYLWKLYLAPSFWRKIWSWIEESPSRIRNYVDRFA